MVEDTLLPHPSGLRLLLGPSGEQDAPPVDGIAATVEGLRRLCQVVVADVDSVLDPFGQAALAVAEQVWVVTEPEPTSVDRAGALIGLLEQRGVRPGRIQVLANQTAATMKVPIAEIAARTGRPVAHALPAFPQACYEAVVRHVPVVELAPDLPSSRVLADLAALIASGRLPITGHLPAPPAAPSPQPGTESTPSAAPPEPAEEGATAARSALRAAASRQRA